MYRRKNGKLKVSPLRVIVALFLLIAIVCAIAAEFLPIFKTKKSTVHPADYYLWYSKATLDNGTQKVVSMGEFPCAPAALMFKLMAIFSVVGIGVLFIGFVLSVAHFFYFPKYGFCLSINIFICLGFLAVEVAAMLAYYMYDKDTCLNSADWEAFKDQEYSLGFGFWGLIVSCVATFLGFLFEIFA